ncbi:MAG TPA: 3-isopropylmalate dehydratase small subunit [Candidatus Desulfofervidus auxilii]|uniref:3-isopropylmalate dehydratase small subunit n=1 Tax=Desulfofervidus auxilii TaxID=1621989 RepID=A0A7V0NEI5_DESA2|nr:3-isopropylmalate dehydratase small subunit [Candidatus Desulfofervidus auxilii]
MIIKGRVWRFGDNIDTDVIIPARYLNISEPEELAKHCMEGIRANFSKSVKEGDIIVAGRNFGCGSSREHAPLAIKAAGIKAIVAKSFARIFYRNAFNIGLPIIESEAVVNATEEGNVLKIDLNEGKITNISKNLIFTIEPLPDFMKELIKDGGLILHLAKKGGY